MLLQEWEARRWKDGRGNFRHLPLSLRLHARYPSRVRAVLRYPSIHDYLLGSSVSLLTNKVVVTIKVLNWLRLFGGEPQYMAGAATITMTDNDDGDEWDWVDVASLD